jgi:hypothetical protein
MPSGDQPTQEIRNMTNTFLPTHEINLTDKRDGERKPSIYVQLLDGAAYTAEEWASSTAADWTCDVGVWAFQGEAAPHAWLSVSVRTLTKEEAPRRAKE